MPTRSAIAPTRFAVAPTRIDAGQGPGLTHRIEGESRQQVDDLKTGIFGFAGNRDQARIRSRSASSSAPVRRAVR